MKRREFIALLGCATIAAPFAARAQQANRAPVLIGWLSLQSREAGVHLLEAFQQGLTSLGWKEGTQFIIEERWGDGQFDRLQPLAEELAAMKPTIILAFPGPCVRAATKAAPNTPIVFAATADPVGAGLVKSLAHPGGMLTGLSNVAQDYTEKHLELLIAIMPALRHVGFLADSTISGRVGAEMKEAAHRSAVRLSIEEAYTEVARPEEIEPAVSRLAASGSQALIVIASPILVSERQQIIKLAAAQRWPVIGWSSEWPEDGALMSYGYDASASLRGAASYVDRILKGAKPGDLPVEQPNTLELVINLKTANALGLTVPLSLQAGAAKVIE